MSCSATSIKDDSELLLASQFQAPVIVIQKIWREFHLWNDPFSLRISNWITQYLRSITENKPSETQKLIYNLGKKILSSNLDGSFLEIPVIGTGGRIWKNWHYEQGRELHPEHPYFIDPPVEHLYGKAVCRWIVFESSFFNRTEVVYLPTEREAMGQIHFKYMESLEPDDRWETYQQFFPNIPIREKNLQLGDANLRYKMEFEELKRKNAAEAEALKEKFSALHQETKETFAGIRKEKEEMGAHFEEKMGEAKRRADELRESTEKQAALDAEKQKEYEAKLAETAEADKKFEEEINLTRQQQRKLEEDLSRAKYDHAIGLEAAHRKSQDELTPIKAEIEELCSKLKECFVTETATHKRKVALEMEIYVLESKISGLQLLFNNLAGRVG